MKLLYNNISYSIRAISFFLYLFSSALSLHAQTITNGTFSSGRSGWGCSPEINRETVYGGSDNSNLVAEIDTRANLCQTISGFTIGHTYTLSFACSRRTTCGPALQSMNLSIDGGALNRSISRGGTTFNFQAESFDFTATATSHTITFVGTSPGTCNLIIDNLTISSLILLPIELISFKGTVNNEQSIDLFWSTKSETDNDYFLIEHSSNAIDWEELSTQKGAGNSTTVLEYMFADQTPFDGNNYYRLKQVNFDGSFNYSEIITVDFKPFYDYPKVSVYPVPATEQLTLTGSSDERSVITIYNAQGQNVTSNIFVHSNSTLSSLDISNLGAGMYILKTKHSTRRFLKE